MSLDVYLDMPEVGTQPPGIGTGIFVRESGRTREISRKEWDEKFPGEEPVTCSPEGPCGRVFEANITHNMVSMANNARIYEVLWRPDENGITTAAQLIEPLTTGLALLRSDPDRFKKFNPSNGWGSYESLVDFVQEYLDACRRYPSATVSVWR